MTIPYTYLIGWISLEKFYYGVRYAENCHPDDLMKTYFTSSKHVLNFIKEHGLPDIVEIRKIFKTKESARIWENKVLKRMKITKNDKFLNRTTNAGFPPEFAAIHLKGKTYEEAYGLEKSNELRKMRSISSAKRKGTKYKSMNRSYSINDMKVCCLKCKHHTSLAQFNRHLKKNVC